MTTPFHGWPADGPAFLAELAADNTSSFWTGQHRRHATAVQEPMRALAAALAPEFGPVRVFRPQVNRRFRPDAPPYRTDTGGVASTPGGTALAVVLTATALAATVGRWSFDAGQLRRYRTAVDAGAGAELERLLGALDGFALDAGRPLRGRPRGCPADHPRLPLLRRRGLMVARSWPGGPWLATAEPLARVRAAWRAAGPLAAWLDEHVGPADLVPPRPRPPVVIAASAT